MNAYDKFKIGQAVRVIGDDRLFVFKAGGDGFCILSIIGSDNTMICGPRFTWAVSQTNT